VSAGSTTIAALRHLVAAHQELTVVELGEARRNVGSALVWIAIAVVGGLVGWCALNAALVMALPQAPWKALCGVAALNLSGALLAALVARGLLRRPLFELTRRELTRDARSLLEIVS
jgi:uncharacterized membrane protein YqjE